MASAPIDLNLSTAQATGHELRARGPVRRVLRRVVHARA